MRRVALALAAAAALVGALVPSAAAGPVPVPGWPVNAPGSTTFLAADGTVLSSGLHTAAYTLDGRKLWQVNDRVDCGNCYGGATPMLSAAGVLGPIGFLAHRIWALDTAGRDVAPCPGVTGPDGDCYALHQDPQGHALLRRTGAVEWTFADDRMPYIDDYLNPLTPGQVAFSGDVVAVQVSAGVESQVVGLERATGRLIWRYGPLDPFVRSILAGPAALPDGTILLFTRQSSSNDCVVVALTPAGAERWRASFSGEPEAFAIDPHSGTTYVGVSWTTPYVVAVSAAGGLRTLVSASEYALPLAVGPDGTVYLGSDPRGVRGPPTLTALDPGGAIRWRFSPSPAGYGVGTPAFAPDGTILAQISGLLYRLRADAVAPPAPHDPRLLVRPIRFRFSGPELRCQPPGGEPCAPASARGAVAELRLPGGVPAGPVTVTLRRLGARRPVKTWQLMLATQPGSQWFGVGNGPEGCPHCQTPAKVAPGRYQLIARWTGRTRLRQVAAPVTILAPGAAR